MSGPAAADTRADKGWRESLATGTVAWGTLFPTQGGQFEQWLIVDPVHERFAAAIGDDWGVGDLQRGELTTLRAQTADAEQ